MKILYPTSIAYPSKLANPEQIVATVAAVNQQGIQCVLGLSSLRADLPFPHEVMRGSKKSFVLAWRYVRLAKREKITHVYCREDRLLFFIMLFGKLIRVEPKYYFEAHTLPKSIVFPLVTRGLSGIVAITQGLKHDLEASGMVVPVAVAHDGVDLTVFAGAESGAVARKRLGLQEDERVVLYAGQLGGWKGVETLLEASENLSATTVIIGGEPAQIEPLQNKYPEVRFMGRRPYQELPHNQAAADVLVLPNTAKDSTSVKYTSPLKLFTYMASGKPIVASDLPSLREVISEQEVFFFEPDNPKSLTQVIEDVLKNPADAQTRAERAMALVHRYTWEARAKTILEFIR